MGLLQVASDVADQFDVGVAAGQPLPLASSDGGAADGNLITNDRDESDRKTLKAEFRTTLQIRVKLSLGVRQ